MSGDDSDGEIYGVKDHMPPRPKTSEGLHSPRKFDNNTTIRPDIHGERSNATAAAAKAGRTGPEGTFITPH